MQIRKLNCNDITLYKNSILVYLKDVLTENNIEHANERVNEIYENMNNFIIDGSAIVFGAIENNKLYGFIWGYIIEKNTIHITQFVVSKELRSKGIGQLLISEIYEYAKKNAVNNIELLATFENKKSLNFYYKQGFEIVRVKMKKTIKNEEINYE